MTHNAISRTAMAVARRNTEEVQGKGDWRVFEQLFAPDFVNHTPPPGGGDDRASVLRLYQMLRTALPDWRPVIHWQTADGDLVTTYKTHHGTHLGDLLGFRPAKQVAPSRPSTPCACATARSSNTGAQPISSRRWNRSARGRSTSATLSRRATGMVVSRISLATIGHWQSYSVFQIRRGPAKPSGLDG